MLFVGQDGMEVVTDTAVLVPAGSASGYGSATVAAHVVPSGSNMARLDINQVVGTSLFVRNLSPFTGGRKASSVTFITFEDRWKAIAQARQVLLPVMHSGLLFAPCTESLTGDIAVTWQCQFVAYHLPSDMRVTDVRIAGKQLLIDVVFVVRPMPFVGK